MTNGERQLYGVTLQLLGGAVAIGAIVVLSCVIGALIPFQVSPGSMAALYAMFGAVLLLGLMLIGSGCGLYQKGVTPHCLRCDFDLEEHAANEACPRCGFVPMHRWPRAE